tara:strand:- start:8385 stop:8861 length:477 start_codon:yes stop_codon:yes gene_type:complete
MIQFQQDISDSIVNYVYLRLTDVESMVSAMITLSYPPLFSATSQQTGKAKNFLPFAVINTKEKRATEMMFITSTKSLENLDSGIINFGDENYPYGFYDLKLYSNSSLTNIDPAVAIKPPVYHGIINVTPNEGDESPTYTSYNDNDLDTMNVYITNQSN